MAQLLIALETGAQPAISGKDNLKTMALVEAAYASAQQSVSFNMENFNVPQNAVFAPRAKPRPFLSRLFSKTQEAPGLSDSRQPTRTPISNFTPRAQQTLALARLEAERFNHHFVGTEHLLLGLIKLGQGAAFNVLQKQGLNLDVLRAEVERCVGAGPEPKATGNIPFTPRVNKALTLASEEARKLNHQYVGTEHILLGLLAEGDGVAARVLAQFGMDIQKTRVEILKELDPNFGA
jgi:hypothetical protein